MGFPKSMNWMKQHDRAGGLIWVILGISLLVGSLKLDLGGLGEPGPGFFPFLAGALLALLGGILFISTTVIGLRGDERLEAEDNSKRKKNWLNITFMLLALFSYPLISEGLGFFLAALLFLSFSVNLIKPNLKKPKGWLMSLVFSLIAVTLSYLIFVVLLGCHFPRGILKLV